MKTAHREASALAIVLIFLLDLIDLCECRVRKLSKDTSGRTNEDYLYVQDFGPVIDYHPDMDEDPTKPAFLYGENRGPTLVEFYAPWCPHCRKFRDKYVALATHIDQIAKDSGAPKISFYGVSCKMNRALCERFEIEGFPHIKPFPEGNFTGVPDDIPHSQLHPSNILNALKVQVDELKLGREIDTITKETSIRESALEMFQSFSRSSGDQKVYRRTKQDVFNDAHRSFDFSLREGVFTGAGAITQAKYTALRHWLQFLQHTLPVAWKIQRVINALLDDFDHVVRKRENLIAILDQYPVPESWSPSCTKGEVGMGYTCGLWQLFHISSVGMIEWNRDLPGDPDKRLAVSALDAGRNLRDFIEQFFGCDECRQNFLKAYDSCALQRCDRLVGRRTMTRWKEYPLWLFEMHNAVNARLVREKFDDQGKLASAEDQKMSQWPQVDDCPKCITEDGKWDNEMILKFLRVEYWLEDSMTVQYRNEIGFDLSALKRRKLKQQSFASPSITMFGICATSLAGLIWRRKHLRTRTGSHKKSDEMCDS